MTWRRSWMPRAWVARSIVIERVKRSWGMLERAAASPAMIRAVTRATLEIDLREVLTANRVPTTVVAREGSFQPRAIPEHVVDLIFDAEFDWQPEAKADTAWRGVMAPFIDAVEHGDRWQHRATNEAYAGHRAVHRPLGSTERASSMAMSGAIC
jgi:hypothetical protein